MPYRKRFDYICTQAERAYGYSDWMKCDRCTANKANGGGRCTRRVCMGLPMCHQHTKSNFKVVIKPSLIQGAGVGVFAHAPRGHAANEPVFRPGDEIAPYHGERVPRRELDRRYSGDCVSPYGLCSGAACEDAGAHRGIGSLVNGEGPRNNRIPTNAVLVFSNVRGAFVVRASRNIMHGDEIIARYGESYWRAGGPRMRYRVQTKKV